MIYDYKVKNVKGNEVSMTNYKGKVLLNSKYSYRLCDLPTI